MRVTHDNTRREVRSYRDAEYPGGREEADKTIRTISVELDEAEQEQVPSTGYYRSRQFFAETAEVKVTEGWDEGPWAYQHRTGVVVRLAGSAVTPRGRKHAKLSDSRSWRPETDSTGEPWEDLARRVMDFAVNRPDLAPGDGGG